MKIVKEARQIGPTIDPKHEIEQVCNNCGYDLDAAELSAATCSDCGQPLYVKQSTTIYATSVPIAKGDTAL